MKNLGKNVIVLALGVFLLIPSMAGASYQFSPNTDDTLVEAYKGGAPSTGDGWIGWYRLIAGSGDTNFIISGANLTGSILKITTGWSGPTANDLGAVAADLTLYSNAHTWMVRLDGNGQGNLFLNPTYNTSVDKFKGTGYIYGGLYNENAPQLVPVWATSGQVYKPDNSPFIVPVTWLSGEVDIDLSAISGLDISSFSFLYASATCANSVLTGSVLGGFSEVPLPPSALLLGTGLLGLVGLGWRRRQSS